MAGDPVKMKDPWYRFGYWSTSAFFRTFFMFVGVVVFVAVIFVMLAIAVFVLPFWWIGGIVGSTATFVKQVYPSFARVTNATSAYLLEVWNKEP